MKTWSNGAKKRMVEIQADRDSANDMRTIAAAFAQLLPGQLKKLLTDDVLAILEKYGLAVE